jgi:hypothetical protein
VSSVVLCRLLKGLVSDSECLDNSLGTTDIASASVIPKLSLSAAQRFVSAAVCLLNDVLWCLYQLCCNTVVVALSCFFLYVVAVACCVPKFSAVNVVARRCVLLPN